MRRSRNDRLATRGEAGATLRPLLSIVLARLRWTPALAVMSAMGLLIPGAAAATSWRTGARDAESMCGISMSATCARCWRQTMHSTRPGATRDSDIELRIVSIYA